MKSQRTDVRLTADLEDPAPDVLRPADDQPFNIAIFGDFSGREGREGGEARSSGVTARLIDRDDFDTVLAALAPVAHLDFGTGRPPVEIRFRDLDDFHPDALFDRLPLFRELRELRARLADPATFASTLAELGSAIAGQPAPPNPSASVALGDAGGLLDLIVDRTAPETIEADMGVVTSAADFRAYVRRIVAPHLVARPDPRQAEMLAQLDGVISEEMRSILHHPRFQALEALWRGVFLLTRRLETGVSLRLYLVDVTKAELQADFLGGGRERTPLRQLLATGPEAGTRGPWSLLVGAYTFGLSDDDIALLYALATIASAVGAPWISAAEPRLVGCPSSAALTEPESWSAPSPAWEALRRMPEARSLGLVLPRFLLRLPYGEDEECERFRFDEFAGRYDHENYLWGNPALACGQLLGQAFERSGWDMRPGEVREIQGLPLHYPEADGVDSPQPVAEVALSVKAAERLMEAGVMPLASMKDQDAAMLVRFQSIAAPLRALAGRWG